MIKLVGDIGVGRVPIQLLSDGMICNQCRVVTNRVDLYTFSALF